MKQEKNDGNMAMPLNVHYLSLQLFPRIYETVLQAVDVIQQLSKQGPVDMNDVSKRITAGME